MALELLWSGETPTEVDALKGAERDLYHGEMRALPYSALLLLIAFGAIFAALTLILMALLVIELTIAVVASLLCGVWTPTTFLMNVTPLLGLAQTLSKSFPRSIEWKSIMIAQRGFRPFPNFAQ
ncbi:MAG: hypothetical protein HKN14_10415 [Marinicaulis sp.]|nr:hypothetical protein [Marinicaulis sp.]NNE41315.1 hypothetical protein [Marinicaulis sp.]NNL88598.1 hypothetical protein [Marinicaulis sp.]